MQLFGVGYDRSIVFLYKLNKNDSLISKKEVKKKTMSTIEKQLSYLSNGYRWILNCFKNYTFCNCIVYHTITHHIDDIVEIYIGQFAEIAKFINIQLKNVLKCELNCGSLYLLPVLWTYLQLIACRQYGIFDQTCGNIYNIFVRILLRCTQK